jgi:hypothetical protein
MLAFLRLEQTFVFMNEREKTTDLKSQKNVVEQGVKLLILQNQ